MCFLKENVWMLRYMIIKVLKELYVIIFMYIICIVFIYFVNYMYLCSFVFDGKEGGGNLK